MENKYNKLKSERRENELRDKVCRELKSIFLTDTNKEVWKDIPRYEGKYQASNLGRIRCLPHVYRNKNGRLIHNSFYYVSLRYSRGYVQATLTGLDGVKVNRGVHRWVMYAFYGESDLQVDHINGIKDDNNLENLRYVTSRENNNYKKDNTPENYTSSLYGSYRVKDKWYSYININKEEHYLGNYKTEEEAHKAYIDAWRDWEKFGKIPDKWINPDRTSAHEGIDFHNASGKWRVRIKKLNTYIGIFDREETALRVLKIVNFLLKKGVILDKEIVEKIRTKYGKDERFRHLINVETKEEFHCVSEAAKSINMNPSTLYSRLNKNLKNNTPIRYK